MNKKIMLLAVAVGLMFGATDLLAGNKSKLAFAKYQPVVGFLEMDSTLAKWFKQYMDTTSGNLTFNDFLKKLSASEVLTQRSKRAGLTHSQLHSPIVGLLNSNLKNIEDLNDVDRANLRRLMVELDLALATIDSTLPVAAHEEFRREVLRGAKPLTEVAKLPMGAVEAMTLTLTSGEVGNRINTSNPSKIPQNNPPIKNNTNFSGYDKEW